MAHDVFISYANEDKAIAEAICSALEANRIACWIAPRDITAGSAWQAAIVQAIPQSRLVVVVLSAGAVASSHVQTEVLTAFNQKPPARAKLPILPFQVGPVALSEEFRYMLGGYHILDASESPLRETLPHLVRDVRRHLSAPVEAPPAPAPAAKATPTSKDDIRAAGAPAKVVLSYKRNAQPDEQLIAFLEGALTDRGHQVFVDRQMKVGLDWPQEIERRVRQADVLIPLLSAASVHSEMLTWEVQTAHDEAQSRHGRPRLLPVRVAFEGPLPSELADALHRLQYFLWEGPYDNPRLVGDLVAAFHGPRPIKPPPPRPVPVGGLPLESAFYVRRPMADDAFHSSLARRDSIVLIRGARQMGKTSLLARGLQHAGEGGARIAFTDFQRLNRSELQSPEAFYKALGALLADELGLEAYPEDVWKPRRAPNINFESYIKEVILHDPEASLVWALDEVDRLFSYDLGSEVFALFRSWHNARTRTEKQAAPWKRLTMAIAYATEAHLFITDLDQSPFNIGTMIALEDFTPEQIADLNIRYDTPLRDEADLRAFHGLVGGQPFLVNRGLFEMAENGLKLDAFAAQAVRDEGIFGDHLRRILVSLADRPDLLEDVRGVLGGKPKLSPKNFYRLRAAGVVAGESAADARPRCPLYATFLKKHLGIK